MREYLAKIDWNNKLKNKTATECLKILTSEIDCIIDECFLFRNRETVKKIH